MKLLVFAHTPPPHHGQSYMVQLMLEGLADSEIECFHVNARVSDDMEDIGGMRVGKLLRLLKYCAEAVSLRFRHGIQDFYYVPAPAKRSAIYRDWLVMLLCRPFFQRLILHWHAYGLGEWAASDGGSRCEKWLTRKLLGRADLSIVLTDYNKSDAAVFEPRRIAVVPNGIPDPCPDFEASVLPQREQRLAARRALLSGHQPSTINPQLFRVLYLAHCTREKGLFDTLDAIALANAQLSTLNSPIRLHLTVAGSFMSEAERAEFDIRIAQPDLALPPPSLNTQPSTINTAAVTYAGFVSGEEKAGLFRESDAFCFPSHWESFGLTAIEAWTWGLPAVVTNVGGLRAIVPPAYGLAMRPGDVSALRDHLLALCSFAEFSALRAHYLSRFALAPLLRSLNTALQSGAGAGQEKPSRGW